MSSIPLYGIGGAALGATVTIMAGCSAPIVITAASSMGWLGGKLGLVQFGAEKAADIVDTWNRFLMSETAAGFLCYGGVTLLKVLGDRCLVLTMFETVPCIALSLGSTTCILAGPYFGITGAKAAYERFQREVEADKAPVRRHNPSMLDPCVDCLGGLYDSFSRFINYVFVPSKPKTA